MKAGETRSEAGCPHAGQGFDVGPSAGVLNHRGSWADLVKPTEVDALVQQLHPFVEISRWIRHYLAQPHPMLGRAGDVCPFVRRALNEQTIWLTAIWDSQTGPEQVERTVVQCLETFLALEPTASETRTSKAILVIFPDVTAEKASDLIDGVQRKLKPAFVEQGLMLGEFHALNITPGLHNEHFYPLRSPIPILAIRHMVESDLVFMSRSSDPADARARFLRGYLRSLPDIAPSKALLATMALRDAEDEIVRLASSAEVRNASTN